MTKRADSRAPTSAAFRLRHLRFGNTLLTLCSPILTQFIRLSYCPSRRRSVHAQHNTTHTHAITIWDFFLVYSFRHLNIITFYYFISNLNAFVSSVYISVFYLSMLEQTHNKQYARVIETVKNSSFQ